MNYLIKIIIIFIYSTQLNAASIENNEIIFKLNNKVFTKVDLERRFQYIESVNNIETSNFNIFEKKEIEKDYISSIIFFEYYLINNLKFENLDEEVLSILNNKIKKQTLNNKEINHIQ